jgi:hypothetical protein
MWLTLCAAATMRNTLEEPNARRSQGAIVAKELLHQNTLPKACLRLQMQPFVRFLVRPCSLEGAHVVPRPAGPLAHALLGEHKCQDELADATRLRAPSYCQGKPRRALQATTRCVSMLPILDLRNPALQTQSANCFELKYFEFDFRTINCM